MSLTHILKDTLQYIKTHRSKTCLIGFNIAWAFCILILLLSLSNKLYNRVLIVFKGYDNKAMQLYTEQTSSEYPTIPQQLALNLPKSFNAIKQATPIFGIYTPIVYKDRVKKINCFGLAPCYQSICHVHIKDGRFFSERDQHTTAPLCVISEQVKEHLFGNKTAIGKYLFLNKIGFKVIGIIDKSSPNLLAGNYICLTNTCFQHIFKTNHVTNIWCSLTPTAHEEKITNQLRAYFTRHIKPKDQHEQWFKVFSLSQHAKQIHTLFHNLFLFNWIIGICFLITGIVNTTNMMIVTIRNRKQEIIIRKILGSSAKEIITMILSEVFIITLMSSIIGCTSALGLASLLNLTCPSGIILPILGTLLLSGFTASIIPIYKALNIQPKEGLTNVL